jgi:hypothetical protein
MPVINARFLIRRTVSTRTALLIFATLMLGGPLAPGAENQAAPGLIVMLKLDDLVRHGQGPGATVSPRWQRVTDFLEREKIKANFGLLADSLEGECPGYVGWIKQRLTNGYVELWHLLKKAVLFLREQHCRFVTASGFLAEPGRSEVPKK